MKQRLAVLQHAKGEGLGSMRNWFIEREFAIHTYHVHLHEALPTLDDFDWLVIMGGPQSVYLEQDYPWLVREKQLIREAIEQNKKVLGICLGGQLIASALGAKVYANTTAEIGWFNIQKNHVCAEWLEPKQTLLSWHNDTFDVPKGATAFAYSDITKCQGFCVGNNVWALQFHIEAQADTADIFLRAGGGTLPEGEWVQDFNAIKSHEHLAKSAIAAKNLLNFINGF